MSDIVKSSKPRTAPEVPPLTVPNVLHRTFAKSAVPSHPGEMGLELGRETVQNQRWLVFAGHYRVRPSGGETEVAPNVRKRRKL